jgi:hypothetical protein
MIQTLRHPGEFAKWKNSFFTTILQTRDFLNETCEKISFVVLASYRESDKIIEEPIWQGLLRASESFTHRLEEHACFASDCFIVCPASRVELVGGPHGGGDSILRLTRSESFLRKSNRVFQSGLESDFRVRHVPKLTLPPLLAK